ncbi:hypothetical protein [Pelistega ratti]|uniref:hypothetical protein n=1 Tax=Pelistega ratti TaxID=2652177 RepID=UPI00135CBE71|nr:hypothetical protein [Pelistega ratti]
MNAYNVNQTIIFAHSSKRAIDIFLAQQANIPARIVCKPLDHAITLSKGVNNVTKRTIH